MRTKRIPQLFYNKQNTVAFYSSYESIVCIKFKIAKAIIAIPIILQEICTKNCGEFF